MRDGGSRALLCPIQTAALAAAAGDIDATIIMSDDQRSHKRALFQLKRTRVIVAQCGHISNMALRSAYVVEAPVDASSLGLAGLL
ncbi:hypothetical protein NDU88_002455 [Pleurodeles waltl]|uniref:LysR substrate-binding domain-containing protein n=1 Tax=Pleurodeles waltl TaxID=8319 RepID=A0AAV7UVN4_PLEWA|nr:hypothetical protein NDU88_002455 [Pleurodeles waltl]